jgi:hypothetical protein
MARIVNSRGYAAYRGVKPQSVRIERHRGGGPPYFRLSESLNAPVFYDLDEADKHFASLPRFRSTGEEKAARRRTA